MNLKPGFSRFLGAKPGRLHFAAHSHHPWPDVSFEAQQRAWLDAAEMMDDKWEHVFGVVAPGTRSRLAALARAQGGSLELEERIDAPAEGGDRPQPPRRRCA